MRGRAGNPRNLRRQTAVRKLFYVAALHRSKALSRGHVFYQYLPQYRGENRSECAGREQPLLRVVLAVRAAALAGERVSAG